MKHQKITNLLTVLLFVIPLALGLILFAALPDKDFSEEENRDLQTFPKLTWKSLSEGKFGQEMNEYFADQFPARDALVGLKGLSELALGKGENNGVVLGKDGRLAVRWFDAYVDRLTRVYDTDFYAKESIDAQTSALNDLQAELAAKNIPLTVIIPPRTLDVVGGQTNYPMQSTDALWADIDAGLDDSVDYLDLRKIMQDAHAGGESVYYRTDHHWTTKGAYMAYCALMNEWGKQSEIIPESMFTIETVEGFYGTTWSRAGLKFVGPDSLEIWHFEGEENYTVTDWTLQTGQNEQGGSYIGFVRGESFSGFYNREYLEQKDKYSAFLDGTHGILTVQKNTDEERQTLLVLKDSFLNSMVPFLAQHYDLVVVNLSAGGVKPLAYYAEQFGCDGVLIVYNAENMIENNALAGVKYAK
ncbi:MAG: hypothetical protein E7594_01140 [Ruminococcaceae bacterium]|nr:hypothetical protein [Oscillospiraceae bacterium]